MFTAFPLRDKTFSCRNEQKEITQTSCISLKIIFIVQEPKPFQPLKFSRDSRRKKEKKSSDFKSTPS